MSNTFIFISGLWFSGGFEKDYSISFYTWENIILDISHHCDKLSHRSSWRGQGSTLDYGFSPGMCSGDLHILEDQMQRAYARNKTKV